MTSRSRGARRYAESDARDGDIPRRGAAGAIQSEELFITSRGRLFRPIGIVPLSPTWSSFQLDARQQAAAIYLFEPGISVREQLTVSYQGLSSDAWSGSLRVLDQERARVKARAQLEAKPDSGGT